ncbi:Transmembrane protein 6/97 [Corchorus olitorius]|uniref:Transmembrane protein 6/97 n=1 Tax=Corchorus olitorius TaxID=93759 RepID=A0A1R3HPJ3_9ROSI|nr:Transmembrane protein 6/97 [Corchorus olitorius]
MGALCKLVDAIVLLMFVLILVLGPLIDSQAILPETIFPEILVRLRNWFAVEFQDFLMLEKPPSYVALVWLALLFQWPLALLNVYGLLTSKPWFNTTCLIFGASYITSTSVVLGEMLGSQKASDTLLMLYSPFMGFSVLAFLRGLIPLLCKAATPTSAIKGPALVRKKKT